MALISELNEFPSFTDKARNLIVVGLSLFTLNTFASGIMIKRYWHDYYNLKNQIEAG
jgi:hypothetical protein